MNVGFTGTREGMSNAQWEQFRYVLALFRHADQAVGRRPVLLHGDGPGKDGKVSADTQAERLGLEFSYDIQRFPPKDLTAEALLARDRQVALACDILVAAPKTDKEQVRSGTWYTVRQARSLGKPVVMLSRAGR